MLCICCNIFYRITLHNKSKKTVCAYISQVFKDEWAWSSSTRQILNDSYMKFPPVQESYIATSGISSSKSNTKDTLISSSVSPVSSPVYSYSSFKSAQQPQQSRSYSNIPLPPSIGSSKSSPTLQNVSINMSSAELVPKTVSPSIGDQSKVYQTAYYIQSQSSLNKYNRELSINPAYASNPNYTKSYHS